MNDNNGENLEEVFGGFFDPEVGKEFERDLQGADRIFAENAVPGPDARLLASIKGRIAEDLRGRRNSARFRRAVYRVFAVAAVFFIVAGVSVKLFERGAESEESGKSGYASIIPAAVWESEDISDGDADSEVLLAEIEELEGELVALQFDQSNGNGSNEIEEVEIETIEMNGDFWKG